MRADVSMEATGTIQSVQFSQGEHLNIGGCYTCPDNGETGGSSKDQKFKALYQDKAKSPQTTKSPEGKVHCGFGSLPVLNPERLRTAKARADEAVKMHKVFSVQGPYPVIRAGLRARGWVEQRTQHPGHNLNHRQSAESHASSNDAGDSDDGNSEDVEEEQNPNGLNDLMSRLVRKEMAYFLWTNRRDAINDNSLQKEQITNHFAKAGSFSTKVGLCVNLRNLHWFDSADPDTFFPRCYRLAAKDEKHAFIEDYRRTACTSLLKYIVEREQDSRKRSRGLPRQIALAQMIDTAVKVCQEFLESLDHSDIDKSLEAQQTLSKEEWEEFIDTYYLVVHGGAEVDINEKCLTSCKALLKKLREVNPQLDIEGMHNIWIIKPGAKSRGRGIKCFKRLDQILRLVDRDPTVIRESKWVVQKYLEHPFLVHGTKFDVRQWFLVTEWNPLTVWFYKKCYLRFSTQPFSLDKLDSSVHLCNNSIQKNLRPSQQRHGGIPEDNMWSDEQFRTFLSSQDQEAKWQAVVIPGMKMALIHALQTTQDLMDSRKNTFELYGADFMLGCDLHPWLLEINVSPTMAPSTHVTARLCAAVQEDTLKVVLDRRADRNADTGDFQLIYRQAAVEVPQYVGINLLVEGCKIKCPCALPPLGSFKHSAHYPRGYVKKKEPTEDKGKPLPRKSLNVAELKTNSSRVSLQPASVTLEPAVSVNVEKPPLPMTVSKAILLPNSAQSRPVFQKSYPKSVQRKCEQTIEQHQSPSLPLEITAQTQPIHASRSSLGY